MQRGKNINITERKSKPELSEKIIEFQLKEIELKEREIELKKRETDNHYHFAKESLKSQSQDYRDLRKEETSKEKMIVVLIFISVIFFLLFLTFAMVMNKDEILTDIIKVTGYVFGGGITGYGIGVHKNKEKNKNIEQM
jgi:hypothetical protein